MMKVYKNPPRENWAEIMHRPAVNTTEIEKAVIRILKKVKKNSDKALYKFTRKLDGVKLKSLSVTSEELKQAEFLINPELKLAIEQAKKNIEVFHLAQKEEVKKIETMPGVTCWRHSQPIEKVGLYIPGGSAPLFSSVLMLAVPARIAGCREIILCTPPSKDGSIHPAILFAAHLCGITKIYKVGGAQAVAAMAFGTKSIPKVYKIFGPGNHYVTTAKLLIQQEGVAIDMPAGPSEVLVIADESAIAEFVAADLLSQAEHGPDSQVILISTNEKIAQDVQKEIEKQLPELSRKKIAIKALQNSKLIITSSLQEAVDLSNLYAPEHLILACENASETAKEINSAGSVFLGNFSPESAGDYASGTNHTLPTNGYSAMYSGVSVDSFVKKITFQHLTKDGLNNIGNTVMTMAAAESLDAHKNAVAIRLKF
jgi:histidinol dehydrogenase